MFHAADVSKYIQLGFGNLLMVFLLPLLKICARAGLGLRLDTSLMSIKLLLTIAIVLV